jgi:hypothetical protein
VFDVGGAERSEEIGGDDEAVRFHVQRGGYLRTQLRFRFTRRVLVEQFTINSGSARIGRHMAQLVQRLVGGHDLQRPRALVANLDAGIP